MYLLRCHVEGITGRNLFMFCVRGFSLLVISREKEVAFGGMILKKQKGFKLLEFLNFNHKLSFQEDFMQSPY